MGGRLPDPCEWCGEWHTGGRRGQGRGACHLRDDRALAFAAGRIQERRGEPPLFDWDDPSLLATTYWDGRRSAVTRPFVECTFSNLMETP